MKFLFVIPNALGKYPLPSTPHIGIAYVAALFMKHNHKVTIVDMRIYPSYENLFRMIRQMENAPFLVEIEDDSSERTEERGSVTFVTLTNSEVLAAELDQLRLKGYL